LDVTDSLGVFVDFTAGIDVITNEVFWIFKSIDPATGLAPTNPLAGFLPVNDSLHHGEGFVNYTIRPKEDAQTGDVINAQARIIFDVNDPIDTESIFNTIDSDYPTSRVQSDFLTVDTARYIINWTGEDKGSGIASYALYVSEDDQPYELLESDLTDTTYLFRGESGHSYGFFTLTEDNVGNKEPMKSQPDVIISGVQLEENKPEIPKEFALYQNYPNPFNPTTIINFDLPKETHVVLKIYNILGQEVRTLVDAYNTAGFKSIQWDGKDKSGSIVSSGIYFYRIDTKYFSKSRKLLILK